jgi:hypothetical protein
MQKNFQNYFRQNLRRIGRAEIEIDGRKEFTIIIFREEKD